ncbi:MAG TPA: hypothetical protein PKG49_10095 [Nitrosomonas mobilis]|nr:hypothetical protein [Nitrosomonas mobilis]
MANSLLNQKFFNTRPEMGLTLQIPILVILLMLLQACTHFVLEDCGRQVLGENEARIRSSHFRMVLDDESAAANRFLPFAAMSTLAYAEDKNCGNETPKVAVGERNRLEETLHARGWQENNDIEWIPACEDDTGLFYRVYTKESDDLMQVVIAFRGTWGIKDWFYGNLYWLTRYLPVENQYLSARINTQKIIDHFSKSDTAVQFYATGHSLGGGLAQHALYSHPNNILQAIAFDPSSATGFSEQSLKNQVFACECDLAELKGEARIYRVYDAYEILSNLRIFHKIFFDPERHIQEVRFPNKASHSMQELASYLSEKVKRNDAYEYTHPWYAGKGNHGDSGELCTVAFENAQRDSCGVKVETDQRDRCPQ